MIVLATALLPGDVIVSTGSVVTAAPRVSTRTMTRGSATVPVLTTAGVPWVVSFRAGQSVLIERPTA